jgi:hypothetical protein
LQRRLDVAELPPAAVGEHFQCDQVRARRHPAVGRVGAGDDAGDIRAVTVLVAGVVVVVGEVVLVNDTIGDAVGVGVGAEERMIQVDAVSSTATE